MVNPPPWSVLAGACGLLSPGRSVLARGMRVAVAGVECPSRGREVARSAAAGVESPSQLVERTRVGPTGAVAYLS